jgi:hypothetical protein
MIRISTLCFLYLLLFQPTHSYGQRDTARSDELKSFTRFDILLPGTFLTRESKLGKNSVAEFSAGIAYGIGYSSSLGWLFNMQFAASGLTKFYYNREKRKEKGKSLRWNAGNYIGMEAVYSQTVSRTPVEREIGTYLLWGMQRPMGGRWIFGFRAGGGYVFDIASPSNSRDGFAGTVWLAFSYVLSERK